MAENGTEREILLRDYIPAKKQGAKRHYGLHPYFTRRPWNVVQEYIRHYCTKQRGVVLDPFGGSGVTAIEAAILGKHGVQYDINPLANFIATQVGRQNVDLNEIKLKAEKVVSAAVAITRKNSFNKILSNYWYPKDVELPANADVTWVEELFTPRQLSDLAVLRDQIMTVKDVVTREMLLLAFSSTLAKTNRTFVSAKNRAESRGGATILSLYRYHVPNKPVELDVFENFKMKVQRVIAAKKETNELLAKSGGTSKVFLESATNLASTNNNSVDYIFTDPPYGSYINYLDLSTMWNAWLGLKVPKSLSKLEAIADNNGDTKYFDLLAQSASEAFRVLKNGSYISVVFCHRDLSYWKKIYELFVDAGFQYRVSVPQPLNSVWSVHKKKSDLSAIAGEVIITFQKTKEKQENHLASSGLGKANLGNIVKKVFGNEREISTDKLYLNLIPGLFESGILDNIASGRVMFEDFIEEFAKYSEKDKVWRKK